MNADSQELEMFDICKFSFFAKNENTLVVLYNVERERKF